MSVGFYSLDVMDLVNSLFAVNFFVVTGFRVCGCHNSSNGVRSGMELRHLLNISDIFDSDTYDIDFFMTADRVSMERFYFLLAP